MSILQEDALNEQIRILEKELEEVKQRLTIQSNSNNTLTSIIQNSPASIVLTNINGEIEYVNESFCQLTGYDFKEVLGQNPRVLKSGHHGADYYKEMWNKLLSGKKWQGEFLNQTKSGDFFWEEAHIAPIKDFDNNIVSFVAIKHNINQRKRIEKSLQESESRYKAIFNNLQDIYFEISLDNILTEISPSVFKILGFKPEDLIGEELLDLPHVAYLPQSELEDENVGSLLQFDTILPHKSGLQIPCMVVACLLWDADLFPLKYVGSIRDISAWKWAEEESIKKTEELNRFFNMSFELLGILDHHSNFYRLSAGWKQILGYELNELQDKKFTDYVHPDDWYLLELESDKLESASQITAVRLRFISKEGNYHWLDIQYEIFSDGKIYFAARDVTERKNAEEELFNTKEYLRLLLHSIPELVFVIDAQGRFVDVVAGSSKLLMLSIEQIIGKRTEDLLPKDLSDQFLYYTALSIEKNEEHQIEYHLIINGELKWFVGKIIPFRKLADGRATVLLVSNDITERKQAELVLLSSEEKFRGLFNRLLVGLCVMTAVRDTEDLITDFYISEMNPKGYEILGFNQDVLKRPDSLLLISKLSPSDAMLIKIVGEEVCEKGNSFQQEYYLQKLDKHFKLLIYKAKIDVIVVIFEDITLQRTATLKLKESEERFRLIFNSSTEGIALAEFEMGTIIQANKGVSELLGIPGTEITGNTTIELGFWKDIEEHSLLIEQLNVYGYVNNHEFSFKRTDGKDCWCLVSANTLKWQGRKQILLSIREITERKLMEVKLQDLNATKDKFFSIIAHDLRNPFNSILGFSELLSKNINKYTPERSAQFAATIFQSAQNTFNLLDTLLQWANSQRGIMKYEPIPLILSEYFNIQEELFKSVALNKNINLQFHCEEELVLIGDKDMISTILRNLISNALKFTPLGGRVQVFATFEDDQTKVVVKDTGVGIDDESAHKLFKIGKNPTTKGTADEKGTGLGLILVSEFIGKHKGKIWVESKIGEGSSFIFTIPLNEH